MEHIEVAISAHEIENSDCEIKRLAWLKLQGAGAPLSNVFGYQISSGRVEIKEPDEYGNIIAMWHAQK